MDVEDVLPEPRRAVHESVRAGSTGSEEHVLDVLGKARAGATQLAEVLVLVDRALELGSLALERRKVRAPLASLLRLLADQLLPFVAERLTLLLRHLAAHEPGLVEAGVEVREELVEPGADVGVLLDVDTAHAEGSEKTVERLAVRKSLHELAEPADSGDKVLLGGRVVDERVERGRLVHVARRVKTAVDPFVEELEDGRDGLMVALVALCAIAGLRCPMTSARSVPTVPEENPPGRTHPGCANWSAAQALE